jgi:hypothetical protein
MITGKSIDMMVNLLPKPLGKAIAEKEAHYYEIIYNTSQ